VINILFDGVVNISTWERKIHRKMYKPICDRGTWNIRTNKELNNLYWDRVIVTDIKIRKLECLGHLIRMENNRNPKGAVDAKLKGKRKVGRRKLRRLNEIQVDFKMIWIKGWRRKAQNQSEWMDAIRKAKVKLHGP
jgi:hypothetical protein